MEIRAQHSQSKFHLLKSLYVRATQSITIASLQGEIQFYSLKLQIAVPRKILYRQSMLSNIIGLIMGF